MSLPDEYAPPELTPPFAADRIRPYRFECWEDGDVIHFLAMCEGLGYVSAWYLVHDRASGDMRAAESVFLLDASSPIHAPREQVVARMRLIGADRGHYLDFGLPSGAWLIPRKVARHILWDLGALPGTPLGGDPEEPHRLIGEGQGNPDRSLAERNGYIDIHRGSHLNRPRPTPEPFPVWTSDGPVPTVRDFARHGGTHGFQEVEDRVIRDFAAAFAPMLASVGPESIAILGRNWTHQSDAYYRAPGDLGERRRQAARLYPVLAPALAWDEGIRNLIDAGRPFEDALRDKINGRDWGGCQDGRGVTTGAVRRLRALPWDDLQDVRRVLLVLSRFPVEWLPATPQGWKDFMRPAFVMWNFASTFGLSKRDLMRGFNGDWKELGDFSAGLAFVRRPGIEQGLDHVLSLAQDPALQLKQTLLAPVARSIMPEAEVQGNSTDLTALAGRLIYGGKTIRGVARVSARWHAGMDRFLAALPQEGTIVRWPGLFQPYTASNAVRLVPLTDKPALVAEGASGPDAAGVMGLAHCVGTYARACCSGGLHIISVRCGLAGGGFERLSTAALRRDPEAMKDQPVRWKVAQHHGRRNGPPPREAEDALAELLAELHSGAVAVNPEALETREAPPEGPYDWRDPGNLERAFAAWAPYLVTGVAKAGLEGVREAVRAAVAQPGVAAR